MTIAIARDSFFAGEDHWERAERLLAEKRRQFGLERASSASERGRMYHGGSAAIAQCPGFWRPIPRQLRSRLMGLIEEADRLSRSKGKQGFLKKSGVAVFRALLFQFLNMKSGRCDPSYDGLAQAAGVARSTVHTALRRLEEAGIVERTARTRLVRMEDGATRRVQITNAYRLGPPTKIGSLIGKDLDALWQRWLASFKEMLTDLAQWFETMSESKNWTETTPLHSSEVEQIEFALNGVQDEGLHQALALLWNAMKARKAPSPS